ncbi:biosynthetic arginine decarboxylase [bacterium endosymbiont of Pedicinus badii]|uniref:biosynthetic arginine decarboxylase n=1 Tax=bacterium endosymbiont of Pedicinus badii TaxID=1719126 RepID=UPI0009B9633F|nr:biosynthetic arginine decarboxylase [bacterium endosymbiont of Pedicinus badii]OQM34017.1 hypothetical protein AOQ89_01495 [bacterium endosymbiont of Pedicinus badii]
MKIRKIKVSKNMYNIKNWGERYYQISKFGSILVYPNPNNTENFIDLFELTKNTKISNKKYPYTVSFPQILKNRVKLINYCFKRAKKKYNFFGKYIFVYPIKVNQNHYVIKSILSTKYTVGLECGSKAELMAIYSFAISKKTIIICNGNKDTEYIKLALIGKKIKYKVYIVIEKIQEIKLILQSINDISLFPHIGIRVKLLEEKKYNKEEKNSFYNKYKFGLSIRDIVKIVRFLRRNKILKKLDFLHFHIGSQIFDIKYIRKSIKECVKFFIEISKLGIEVHYIDVGGGIAVDYSGIRNHQSSKNYEMQEYANCIVKYIKNACQENRLLFPTIITESGRTITAHHKVLISKVTFTERSRYKKILSINKQSKIIKLFWKKKKNLIQSIKTEKKLMDGIDEIEKWFQKLQKKYKNEKIDIFTMNLVDQIYKNFFHSIFKIFEKMHIKNRKIQEKIEKEIAEKMHVNFSIFQSLPDIWGIKQIFPILPIHGLNEKLSNRSILVDNTCDSDGIIKKYVGNGNIKKTLLMYDYNINNPPVIGFFMIGAYQDILGNFHNLFGKTKNFIVKISRRKKLKIKQISSNDKISDMLNFTNINYKNFINNLENKKNKNDLEEKNKIIRYIKSFLKKSTYLE